MSTSIDVSVALFAYEDDLAGGARIVGNLYPAGATGTALRNIVFPCGINVRPARYEVEPGRYVVSVTMPSGAVLTDEIEARADEVTPVVLDATDSPHETHSWQYLMGNIEQYSVYHDPATTPVPRSTGSRYTAVPTVSPPFMDDGSDWDPGNEPGPAEPTAAGQVTVSWVGNPRKRASSFESMLAVATADAATSPADVLAATRPRPLPVPDQTDGTSHLYRFTEGGPVSRPGGHLRNRRFLVVELGDATHVVTLPMRWPLAQIEVLVNERQSPTGSAVAVTVRDPAVGAGLAYLSSGAFEAAAALFADVEDMLYAKMYNPLAAAAGAYVLIGTDLADEPRRWDPWLVNLRDWFDWMSDGSVLWATRRLRTAETDDDLRQARDGLIEAFDLGVPHYTVGLSWLIDGLSEFPDDEGCATRLEQARRLSWCVDQREPFVIVRSRGRSG